MKNDPPPPSDEPPRPANDSLDRGSVAEDCFVSAALEELARLGPAGEDQDLVHGILLATVSAPKLPRRQALPPTERQTWLAASALVAALVALLVAVLSNVPFRPSAAPDHGVRFVVSYPLGADPIPNPGSPSPVEGAPMLPPRAYEGSVPLVVIATASPGGTAEIVIRDTPLELVEALSPTVIDFSKRRPLSDRFRIEADESVHNEHELAYCGNVTLRHERFTLEADRVWLETAVRSEDEPEAIWSAENARLRFHAHPDGMPVREADALILRFDSLSGRMFLEGVSRLETLSGAQALPAAARVRLSRNAYQIEPGASGDPEAEVRTIRQASPRGERRP